MSWLCPPGLERKILFTSREPYDFLHDFVINKTLAKRLLELKPASWASLLLLLEAEIAANVRCLTPRKRMVLLEYA